MNSIELKENHTVAVLKDISSFNIKKGDVGTVVSILSDDVVEVEFIDKKGVPISISPIKKSDLIRLRLNPIII
jgi:hypothetical protein